MKDRKLKKKEVMEILNLTEYGLEQWIEKGILDKPIRFKCPIHPNPLKNRKQRKQEGCNCYAHPFFTESQVERAQLKLIEFINNANPPTANPRPVVCFSAKLCQRIRASGARVRLR